MEAWYGITQTRQVYEKAIKDLTEEGAREVTNTLYPGINGCFRQKIKRGGRFREGGRGRGRDAHTEGPLDRH